jgi:hypothetical protein
VNQKKWKTITGYVYEKVWEDGGHTLSFRMDDYTRNALNSVPAGEYVQIKQRRDPGSDEAKYYMVYEDKSVTPQQPEAPITF